MGDLRLFIVAPEVIELKGASRASDIRSLGCTVIELLTGRPPSAGVSNGKSGKLNFSYLRPEFNNGNKILTRI